MLFTSIRLDIFTHLDSPITAEDLSKITSIDEKKLDLLLMTLTSCGFIRRNNKTYENLDESRVFLSKNSELYLGDSIIFREEMTSLSNLGERIKGGSSKKTSYDFVKLTKMTIPEMYSGRVQNFVQIVNSLYVDREYPLAVLDLGGGSGILDIELMNSYLNGKAVVFDRSEVIVATDQIIKDRGAKRVFTAVGDFNTDSFDGTYDIVIASGILNFVNIPMEEFIEKISKVLKTDGHFIVVGQLSDKCDGIPPNILGWLSGYLEGLPLVPAHAGVILRAGVQNSFRPTGPRTRGGDSGRLSTVISLSAWSPHTRG